MGIFCIFKIFVQDGRFSIYIYIYIYRICKNYCFPNESCRKAGRNYCKFQAETKIKISK